MIIKTDQTQVVIQRPMKVFFSRPSPKASRELQTALDRIMDKAGTLSEISAGAGHRAMSLRRDCVLVILTNPRILPLY